MRRARAIPYTLHVNGRLDGAFDTIDFASTGGAAALFQVWSAGNADPPRSYTVESGQKLTDSWDVGPGYDLAVHGPNGFFRGFKGGTAGQQANLQITASYDTGRHGMALRITNRGSAAAKVTVRNGYTKRSSTELVRVGEGQNRKDLVGTPRRLVRPRPHGRGRPAVQIPLLRPRGERLGQHHRPDDGRAVGLPAGVGPAGRPLRAAYARSIRPRKSGKRCNGAHSGQVG